LSFVRQDPGLSAPSPGLRKNSFCLLPDRSLRGNGLFCDFLPGFAGNGIKAD
jgi:hypothetical protein